MYLNKNGPEGVIAIINKRLSLVVDAGLTDENARDR